MRGLRQLLMMIALIPACAMAQEEETADFTSDLFGGVTGVDILPKGRFQWETFASYAHSTLDDVTANSWSLNTSVLRYGISSTTELCLQGAYDYARIDGENYNGFANLGVGFKTRLFEGWKAIPAVAIRGWLYFPGGKNSDFLPERFGYQLDLMFYNQLASWCDLSYMGSMVWGDSEHRTTFWGASLGFGLSDRLTFSVEEDNYYYGDDVEDRWQPYLSLTLSYQVHPRVELGLTSDIFLKNPKRSYDFALGVAWQLTKK